MKAFVFKTKIIFIFANIYSKLKLKKLISILTVIVVLFNAFGNLIVLKSIQYNIYREVRSDYIKNIPDSKLIKITINNNSNQTIQFIESDEFVYNNNMYDVVRKVTKENCTEYYCLNDNKETELYTNLNNEVLNNMDSNPVKTKTQQILKKINTPLFFQDTKKENANLSHNINYPTNKLITNSTYFVVLTPPPQVV